MCALKSEMDTNERKEQTTTKQHHQTTNADADDVMMRSSSQHPSTDDFLLFWEGRDWRHAKILSTLGYATDDERQILFQQCIYHESGTEKRWLSLVNKFKHREFLKYERSGLSITNWRTQYSRRNDLFVYSEKRTTHTLCHQLNDCTNEIRNWKQSIQSQKKKIYDKNDVRLQDARLFLARSLTFFHISCCVSY